MSLYEFRKPDKNYARDDMLLAMKSRAVQKRELISIGRRYGLFDGEVTGMVYALATNGDIKSLGQGWWGLAAFTPELVGEVEVLGPDTSRVGEVIFHKGVNYYREGSQP